MDTKDPRAEDQLCDYNKIKLTMQIKLLLKTFGMICIILNFSYFFGMFWLIICITVEDIRLSFEEVLKLAPIQGSLFGNLGKFV